MQMKRPPGRPVGTLRGAASEAERKRNSREKQKKAGLVRLEFVIPSEKVEEVKKLVESLCGLQKRTTRIVWNGVDGYVELAFAKRSSDYEIIKNELYTKTEIFSPFDCIECSANDVPTDEDGEMVFCGDYLITENKKYYKLI